MGKTGDCGSQDILGFQTAAINDFLIQEISDFLVQGIVALLMVAGAQGFIKEVEVCRPQDGSHINF